jgi:hypothetical protein
MGFRNDLRKIKDIGLAAAAELAQRVVHHKHAIAHRTQKFQGLMIEGGVFSQKQDIQVRDGFKYQFFPFQAAYQVRPVFLEFLVSGYGDMAHSGNHLVFADINIMGFEKKHLMVPLIALVHNLGCGIPHRINLPQIIHQKSDVHDVCSTPPPA